MNTSQLQNFPTNNNGDFIITIHCPICESVKEDIIPKEDADFWGLDEWEKPEAKGICSECDKKAKIVFAQYWKDDRLKGISGIVNRMEILYRMIAFDHPDLPAIKENYLGKLIHQLLSAYSF